MVRYEELTITCISDLLKHLKLHKQDVKGPIWYRGHAKKSWILLPSLLRPENKKYTESNLLKEFKKDALLLLEPIPQEQYEWLFVMRHNHVPTRLLDWTENPLTALHFALFEEIKPEQNEDGVLWLLSPVEMNKASGLFDGDSLPSFEENKFELSQYTPEKYSDIREKIKHKPIAFIAPRNSSRMQAQQSVFTIHHKIEDPLESGDSKYVWRYSIPKDVKKDILHELHLLGINVFQLYPELPRIYDKIKEVGTT